jgi:hypothetical protein
MTHWGKQDLVGKKSEQEAPLHLTTVLSMVSLCLDMCYLGLGVVTVRYIKTQLEV